MPASTVGGLATGRSAPFAPGAPLAGPRPRRAFGTGLLPVPGGTRYYSWRGFVPFKKMPHHHGSGLQWLVASPYPEELESIAGVTWLWKSTGAADRLRELLTVTPGITGLWQVKRQSAASDEIMRRLDLHYVGNRTLGPALEIPLLTPVAPVPRVDG